MPTVDALSTGAAASLAAGGGAVLAQLVQAFRHRGKDRSDEASVIVGSAREVVELLRTELREQEERHRSEMSRLREQLAEAQLTAATAKAEAEAAQSEITKLRRALAAAGGAPTG